MNMNGEEVKVCQVLSDESSAKLQQLGNSSSLETAVTPRNSEQRMRMMLDWKFAGQGSTLVGPGH